MEMVAELDYAAVMVLYGFLIAAGYHLLLVGRAVFLHTTALVDAEDILFLMSAGFLFFLAVYRMNYGILRWYAFAGVGLGVFLYLRTFARLLELFRKWLLQKRRKAYTIKKSVTKRVKDSYEKFSSKGQVSEIEGSSPEHEAKRKKKERS